MDNNNSKPPGGDDDKPDLTPDEREKLRKKIVDELDESAKDADLSKDEEEVLFHLAYKAG